MAPRTNCTLSPTNCTGVLISWAMPAASWPTAASFSDSVDWRVRRALSRASMICEARMAADSRSAWPKGGTAAERLKVTTPSKRPADTSG